MYSQHLSNTHDTDPLSVTKAGDVAASLKPSEEIRMQLTSPQYKTCEFPTG